MIEAVGWKDFGTFFDVCASLLEADGAMAAAGDHDRRPRLRRREGVADFIRKLHLPRRLPAVARGDRPRGRPPHRPADGRTSRTSRRTTPRRCGAGARTSTPAANVLAQRGYDERFQRIWRLYLCWCEAGFDERRIGPTCRSCSASRRGTAPCPSRTRSPGPRCTARRPGRATGCRRKHDRRRAHLRRADRLRRGAHHGARPSSRRSWLGAQASNPTTQIPLRGARASREIGLATAALLASLSGAPVRPWLVAHDRRRPLRHPRERRGAATASRRAAVGAVTAVGGASAAITAAVAAAAVDS